MLRYQDSYHRGMNINLVWGGLNSAVAADGSPPSARMRCGCSGQCLGVVVSSRISVWLQCQANCKELSQLTDLCRSSRSALCVVDPGEGGRML